jgi:hypothetical protein
MFPEPRIMGTSIGAFFVAGVFVAISGIVIFSSL